MSEPGELTVPNPTYLPGGRVREALLQHLPVVRDMVDLVCGFFYETTTFKGVADPDGSTDVRIRIMRDAYIIIPREAFTVQKMQSIWDKHLECKLDFINGASRMKMDTRTYFIKPINDDRCKLEACYGPFVFAIDKYFAPLLITYTPFATSEDSEPEWFYYVKELRSEVRDKILATIKARDQN